MLNVIQKIEQCKLPTYTQEQFLDIDKQLNSIYQQIQNRITNNFGEVRKNEVKKTERAWIKYREALVDFAQKKCPSISAESWKTIITKERLSELKQIAPSGPV